MKTKEIYTKILETSKKEIADNTHLAHVFIMPKSTYSITEDELTEQGTEMHIGFYNKDSGKISSIKYYNESIEEIPEEEIFQKEEHAVQEIDLDRVKIDLEDALKIAKEKITENFKETVSLKTMIVLQHIISYGFIWNITILRRDFKTLNIKIDAVTGKIKHTSCESLIDLEKSLRKDKK